MLGVKRFGQVNIQKLEQQWKPGFARGDSKLYEHCRPYLEEAKRICAIDTKTAAVGIYGLFDPTAEEELSFPGFTKVIRDETKNELALAWNAWHPQYEGDPPPLAFRVFCSQSYISAAVDLALCVGARSLSIYVHNGIVREWVKGLVDLRSEEEVPSSLNDTLSLDGNWFRIGDVTKGSM